MNWKLIFQLSVFGLIMAVATISLISQNIEPIFWLVILIISAWVIAKAAPRKYFLHGFLVCLVNCLWIIAAHVLFYNTYIVHHPAMQNLNNVMPAGMATHPRLIMAITGPVFGILSGLVLGIFALIASKIIKKA
ncbi:MAG: hypothetical protein ABI367_11980 [Mucilaginibacter sp.]